MTALNFPNSPARGDIYGTSYQWDGEKWIVVNTNPNIVPPLDGLSPTGAWSVSRKLRTAYGGAYYSDAITPSRVQTLYDQSGNARDLSGGSGGNRPTITTISGSTASVMSYNDSILSSSVAMTSFISDTSGYMIVSGRATGPNGATSAFQGSKFISDSNSNAGITCSTTAGGTIFVHTWDTGEKKLLFSSLPAGVTHVMEWRHEGGILYGRVDGGTEQSITAGTTTTMGSQLFLGHWDWTSYIYEAATFSTPPTLAQRNALMAAFKFQAGVP